jgi:hypothetical protein
MTILKLDHYPALDAISALDLLAEVYSASRNFRLNAEFPLTVLCPPPCPACGREEYSMELLIAHLNDHPHSWTRERIADHVATIERSLEDVASHEVDKRVVSESDVLTPS